MGTRPVMKWLLADALDSKMSNNDNGPSTDMLASLDYYPGIVLDRNSLVTLPIYVPSEFEIPGWVVPDPPKDAREVVKMALAQATQLQDHATQVLCLQVLILLTSQDPTNLFSQLGHIQKSVLGDTDGYLRTLLSSYLTCKTKPAEIKLLAELRQLDNWTELNLLRDAELHFAKQQMERVLAARVVGDQRILFAAPSRLSMVFYPWLSVKALDFVKSLTHTIPPNVEGGEDNPVAARDIRTIPFHGPNLLPEHHLLDPIFGMPLRDEHQNKTGMTGPALNLKIIQAITPPSATYTKIILTSQ